MVHVDTDFVYEAGGADKQTRLRMVQKTKAHNAKIGYNFHPILKKYSESNILHDEASVYKPLAVKFAWKTAGKFT